MKTIYYCVMDDTSPMGQMYWARDHYQTVKIAGTLPEEKLVEIAKVLAGSEALNYIGHNITKNGDDIFVTLLVDNGLSKVGPMWRSDASAESFCRSLTVNSYYELSGQ